MSERGDNATKRFTCSYEFDGSKWSVDIWASTREEAEMKLRAAGKGEVLGLVTHIILAGPTCPLCGRDVEEGHEK